MVGNQVDLFEKFKQNSRRWNCFSDSDTLGTFDFMTLTIALESIESRDVENLVAVLTSNEYHEQLANRELSFDLYGPVSKCLPLAIHEYTHFIDTVSTVWGQEFLGLLNKAYKTNPDQFSTLEPDFHHAKGLANFARALRLPDYYTAKESLVDASRPWRCSVTSGRWFSEHGHISDHPIVFVVFNNSAGQRIVRSPISTVSLLEASALAQEFMYRDFLVSALPEDARTVESHAISREVMDFIYNVDLTEYTVCAHLVANSIRSEDVLDSLKVASRLANYCLNMTPSLFRQIRITADVRKKIGLKLDGSRAESEIEKGFTLNDRGFLFYLISQLLPSCEPRTKQSVDSAIASAFNEVGIAIHDITLQARRSLEVSGDLLQPSPFVALQEIGQTSLINFDERASSEHLVEDFARFELPSILLGDSSIHRLSGKKDGILRNLDIERSYSELVEGQLWVEKFSEACS